jgi:sterol desaturase/sphingolipid hydroxylase (fatty acid hydroxylase superfamily)
MRKARPERLHNLDRMTLRQLVEAYFAHHAIRIYFALAALCIALTATWATELWPVLYAVVAALVAYPLVEYLVHRFILHGRYLYKSPRTAALWKRIHFDHHRDPNDLRVLFGALHTTLPIIVIATGPLGWLIGGVPGMTAALATGLLSFTFYEFCHCIQHLAFKPRSRYLRRIKKRHLAHHFHYEQGNFGITSHFWDRAFGTFYDDPKEVPRSATVFNLGYTDDEARHYPWVADLSRLDPPPQQDAMEAFDR